MPVRTIATTIAMVLATVLVLLMLREVTRVLTWIVVAVFFSVALAPVVGWVDRRVTGGRRALSTLVVFLVVVLLFGGLITAFAVPLAKEGTTFAGQLPGILADAKAGRISITSPLARALIGKAKGASVEVVTPSGAKAYEVKKVEWR